MMMMIIINDDNNNNIITIIIIIIITDLGGAGPNWEQFRSAQVPSQLAPRSVELIAGPNWEHLVQLA